MFKVFCGVISTPGPIVSFSILTMKSFFRRHKVNGLTGKRLMQSTAEEIAELQLGEIHHFTFAGNKSKIT